MNQRKGRGGRPSKGDRYARTIRIPAPLNEAITSAAADAGYVAVSDFVVDLLVRAEAAGWLAGSVRAQEPLPISA